MSRWSSSRPTRSPSKSRRPPPVRWARIVAKDGETVAVGALLGQINEGGLPPPSLQPRLPKLLKHLPRPRHRRLRLSPPHQPQLYLRRFRRPRRPMRRWRRPCEKFPPRAASMPQTVPGSGKDGRVHQRRYAGCDREGRLRADAVNQPAAAVQVRAPSPADDASRESA